MEEIVQRQPVPAMPEDVKIQYAARGSLPSMKIRDISADGIQDILGKVRDGEYTSLLLSPDEECAEGFLVMESSVTLLSLQIWDAGTETAWSFFDPDYLESGEESTIIPSDGQSVIPMRNTIPNTPENRALTAQCVEWYAHACKPYPGMEWLKENQ